LLQGAAIWAEADTRPETLARAGAPKSYSAESGEPITAREEEVLRQITLGYSNKEIAARLAVSVKTVEAHKANGARKLGLGTRMDIVSYEIFRGWMRND
jgi:DNA-binding NarL/FixJ family response regulator